MTLAGMQVSPWGSVTGSPSMLSNLSGRQSTPEPQPAVDLPKSGRTGLEPSIEEVQVSMTNLHQAQQIQRVCARQYNMLRPEDKLQYEADMLEVYVLSNEGRAQLAGRERHTDAGQNPPRTTINVEWVELDTPTIQLDGRGVDTRKLYDEPAVFPVKLFANTYNLGCQTDRRQYELDLERLYWLMSMQLVRILEKDRMIDISLEIPYTVVFMEWLEFETRMQVDPDNENRKNRTTDGR